MLFASIILKETLNLSSKSLVTFKCLLKWWAWTLDALTTASGESVLKVSAAPAVGEEVVGEITMRPDKSEVTVAVTGGDYDMSSQTIIGPDSWIAPTTLCQRCGACEAGMVLGWCDSSQKFECDMECVCCTYLVLQNLCDPW